MTKKPTFCGQCGAKNPHDNNFCHSCGMLLVKLNNEISLDKLVEESEENLEPTYELLEQKLFHLADVSGFFIMSNEQHFVQFFKEDKSFKIYVDLGKISNFSKVQLQQIENMGFIEKEGIVGKVITLTYKEKKIREIVLLTKQIFEEVYRSSTSDFFTYDENYENKIRTNNNLEILEVEAVPSKKISGQTIFFGIIILLAVVGYCNTNDGPSTSTNQVSASQSEEESTTFSGQKFTFKSTLNDNELDGKTVQTNHETTYHTFDFINMTVTNKSPINGEWLSVTYPINGVYAEKGIVATTYVIKVGTLGVKEIWFSPDVPNLGYDYDDGTRISCYKITRE